MSPKDIEELGSLALTGVVVALGQYLLSPTLPHWRFLIGRMLVTAALAMASGSALAIVPGLPFLAMIGIAAGLATLGTSFLEEVVRRGFDKFIGKKPEVPADEADQ